ncbi:methionyl-tRNA formyltransferase [Halioxenophilus aromaticivorans]|uniref:Methionyl-tRNA formyltransferase n=1 Tax=Halioxenophilus aromaticivorans TaxID=1306992 RepID=A0AAV3U920_9ALTE
MTQSLSIVFAGTPDFAAFHLSAVLASQHTVSAVYTQPDRPAGRGKKLHASAVKQVALAHELPVHQPLNFKSQEDRDALAALKPDVLVVVAYGLILPQAVLDIPKYGCLNVHASILPRWRGAAPIQRAVEAGDALSGVTIMQMERGLDTGPMLNKVFCDITEQETGGSLHDKLQALGAPALIDTLDQLSDGQLAPETQDDSQANYAHKIEKDDLNINWQQPAEVVARTIRAFSPFPVCFSQLGDKRIKLYQATMVEAATPGNAGEILSFDKTGVMVACGVGAVKLHNLQIPGKKPMTADQLLNGYKELFAPGQVFRQA